LLSDGADFPAVPAIEGADEVGGNNRTVLPISVPVEDVSDRHLVQDVSSVGGGWLILTDAWDPGWTVEIDGEAAVVHIANGFQRAVKLETGAKQVRWFYTPPGLWLGLLVSLVSSLCLLLMAWLVPSDPSVERITNEGRHAQ
jgi:uncharacterized membrane protein YfhO